MHEDFFPSIITSSKGLMNKGRSKQLWTLVVRWWKEGKCDTKSSQGKSVRATATASNNMRESAAFFLSRVSFFPGSSSLPPPVSCGTSSRSHPAFTSRVNASDRGPFSIHTSSSLWMNVEWHTWEFYYKFMQSNGGSGSGRRRKKNNQICISHAVNFLCVMCCEYSVPVCLVKGKWSRYRSWVWLSRMWFELERASWLTREMVICSFVCELCDFKERKLAH